MASKVYHIELSVANVDDPERITALRHAVQNAARQLHAAALLITGDDKVEPEINIYGEDFAEGKVEITLEDEEG